MSTEEAEDVPKRKRYKMILDPSYDSSMLSMKREKIWNEAAKENLTKIRAKKGETSQNQKQVEEELLKVNAKNDSNYDVFFNNYDDFLTDDSDEKDDEFQNVNLETEDFCQTTAFDEMASKDNGSKLGIGESLKHRLITSPPFLAEDGERVMFENSGLTVNDVMELVVAFSINFGSTNQQREWLVEMLKLCAGPAFKDIKLSNYKLSKLCDPPPDKIIYHFYCDNCQDSILHSCSKKEVKGQNKVCSKCAKSNNIVLSNPHVFLTIDLEYQFNLLLQNEEVASFLLEYFKNQKSPAVDSTICDVNDSELHKSIVVNDDKILTYIISTDGAPLFNMSKRSFWPLQVILNFLPPQLRFKYVLLVGIMIVRHEPKPDLMNLFIKKYMEEVINLQTVGVKIKLLQDDKEIIVKLILFCIVADSKARPVLQNRLQYNGYSGCSYCYHIGKYIHGAGIRYPFLEIEPELRTHETHMKDVADVQTLGSASVRGVKGDSAFSCNPFVDMVWGFPLDYFHNAVLGITEKMWSDWNKNHLTPSDRREIDELLLEIQPPSDLHRVTEKISAKSVWKGSNWKSWLLYYSLPIMSKYLPTELLEHYLLFVNSIKTLLKIEITETDLCKCEEDLLIFVGNFQTLYGADRMTFNVHIVLHAVQSVRMSGPLWSTSAFPFEHNIFCLKNTINGPKSIEQQISKKLLTRLSYKLKPQNPNTSILVQEYCKNIFSSKRVTKSALTFENVTFFGPHQKNKFQEELEFDRCIINNRIYSSTKYNRIQKFNDTIIVLKNGKIAQIIGIKVIRDVKCWFELRELVLKPFYVGKLKVDCIWEVTGNIQHAETSLSEIESKVVGLDFSEKQYVCLIPNTVEAQ